jgi:metal-responsive CopG/Arc/MetJ family transcriptional regulator
MRTTLDLPEDLLGEALKISRCRTKTEVIKKALQSLIQRERVQGLQKYKGKIDLNIDLGSLRKR